MKKLSVVRLVCLLLLITISLSFSGCFLKRTEESSSGYVDNKKNYEEISEVCQSITVLKNSDDFKNHDIDTKTDMVLEEIEKQAKEKRIMSDSIYCDEKNHYITFEFSSGALGCDIVGGFDEKIKSPGLVPTRALNDIDYPASGGGRKADALILNATNDIEDFSFDCSVLAKSWSDAGINTKIDNAVTLDDLTKLKGYEFVYFSMHGSYLYSREFNELKYAWEHDWKPFIHLEQIHTEEIDAAYLQDIYVEKTVRIAADGHYYISPEFFERHYSAGSLSGSIFFFGSCQLMGANGSEISTSMEEVFSKLSLAVFVAYYNSVFSDYDFDIVNMFMYNLILGETAKESLADAQNGAGKTDVDWYKERYSKSPDHAPAYPLLRGNENATLKWEGEVTATPTPTPEPSYSSELPGTSETTVPVVRPTVKVSDAVKKKVKNGDSKQYYRIPKVTISGKNMNSVNKKIKKTLAKAYSNDWYEMGYSSYIDDKIVSIVVQVQHTNWGTEFDCRAFNISVATGKLISDGAVLKLYGTSKSKFISAVKKSIKKFGGGTSEASNKERKTCIKKNLKRASYKYVDPYINKNGHLCFVGNFYWMNIEAGDYNKSRFAFDTKTNKEIYDPGGL